MVRTCFTFHATMRIYNTLLKEEKKERKKQIIKHNDGNIPFEKIKGYPLCFVGNTDMPLGSMICLKLKDNLTNLYIDVAI